MVAFCVCLSTLTHDCSAPHSLIEINLQSNRSPLRFHYKIICSRFEATCRWRFGDVVASVGYPACGAACECLLFSDWCHLRMYVPISQTASFPCPLFFHFLLHLSLLSFFLFLSCLPFPRSLCFLLSSLFVPSATSSFSVTGRRSALRTVQLECEGLTTRWYANLFHRPVTLRGGEGRGEERRGE